MQYENVNHILRFSLDRKFTNVDTANPDSGDVEAPHGPRSGMEEGPWDSAKRPGFSAKKTEREVPAPRPYFEAEHLLLG
jgi:hypothetical protein